MGYPSRLDHPRRGLGVGVRIPALRDRQHMRWVQVPGALNIKYWIKQKNNESKSCRNKKKHHKEWFKNLVIALFFVWLAVPSKPSIRSIWLKFLTHCSILICIHESAKANAPLTIKVAPPLPRGPWSLIS